MLRGMGKQGQYREVDTEVREGKVSMVPFLGRV